jgi:hypothetical protein
MIRTLRKLIRETLEQDAPGREVVTFDFDDTLLWTEVIRDEFEDYVEHVPVGPNKDILPIMRAALQNPDNDVYVVTSRSETARSRREILDYLSEWGILEYPNFMGVHFTNGELKVAKLLELGASKHYDDDPKELEALEGTGIKWEQAFPHESWMKKSAANVNGQD